MTPSVALCNAVPRRDGLENRIWSAWAYIARYGKQPLSELKRMSYAELLRFDKELSLIVEEENASKGKLE